MGDLKTEPTSKVGASSKSEAPAGPGGGISSKIHDAVRKTDGYSNQAKLYAPKELSPDKFFAAYEATRRQGFAPSYIGKLEAGLGLAPTMSPSPELAKAIAERETAAGKKPTGKLDTPQRKWLATELPELATEAPFPVVGEAGTARARKGSTEVPENEAVQNAGLAANYTAYLATLSKGSFLGHGVVGHPQFLARVSGAESYLVAKLGKGPGEIGEAWGIEEVEGLRPSTKAQDQLHHGTGFALDVNSAQNNWNFGNGANAAMMEALMQDVALLLGQKVDKSAANLAATKGKTTEEIYDAVSASNEALKRYRSLAADPAALAAYVQSPDCPEKARAVGVDGWKARMAKQESRFAARAKANATVAGPAGFMDQRKELIVALRDVGGLRWGATDFGEKKSGDIMHFDGHHMGTAEKIRREKAKVVAASAAKKTDAGGQ